MPEDRDALIRRLVASHKERRASGTPVSLSFAPSPEGSVNFASDLLNLASAEVDYGMEGLSKRQGANYFQENTEKETVREDKEESFSQRAAATLTRSRLFRERNDEVNAKPLTMNPIKSLWPESAGNSQSYRAGRDERVRKEKERLRKEAEEQWSRQCTFQPTLPTRQQPSHPSVSNRRQSSGGDAHTRLYADAKEREASRQYVVEQLEDSRSRDLTFTPQLISSHAISPSSSSSPVFEHRPIHERVEELQRDRSQRIAKLKEWVEASDLSSATFAPSLTERSALLAEKRSHELSLYETKDLGSRLQLEGRIIEAKKQIAVLEHQREKEEEFKSPQPCVGTQLIAQSSPLLEMAFEDRQQMFLYKQKLNNERRQRDMEKERGSWFQPKVCDQHTSSIIQKHRPELLEETEKERVWRLSRGEQCVRDLHLREKERQVYGNLSFTPLIDPLSRALGRASSLEELVHNFRGLRKKEHLQLKREEEFQSQCTFQPMINCSYHSSAAAAAVHSPIHLADSDDEGTNDADDDNEPASKKSSDYGTLSRNNSCTRPNLYVLNPEEVHHKIEAQRKERELQREALLTEQRLRELSQCTFQPRILPPPSATPSSSKPILVRGLGHFIQQRELCFQREREQKQRELDAFRVSDVEKFRNPADSSTIVQVL